MISKTLCMHHSCFQRFQIWKSKSWKCARLWAPWGEVGVLFIWTSLVSRNFRANSRRSEMLWPGWGPVRANTSLNSGGTRGPEAHSKWVRVGSVRVNTWGFRSKGTGRDGDATTCERRLRARHRAGTWGHGDEQRMVQPDPKHHSLLSWSLEPWRRTGLGQGCPCREVPKPQSQEASTQSWAPCVWPRALPTLGPLLARAPRLHVALTKWPPHWTLILGPRPLTWKRFSYQLGNVTREMDRIPPRQWCLSSWEIRLALVPDDTLLHTPLSTHSI